VPGHTEGSLRVVHCENDGNGGSRLREDPVVLSPTGLVDGQEPMLASAAQQALAVTFVEVPVGTGHAGWHAAPALQYVVVLRGHVEVECTDGQTRHLHPGDVILAADTEGIGHRVTVTGEPVRLMFVTLARPCGGA
jgi:quercetin dioxygenase-like cupin family protein